MGCLAFEPRTIRLKSEVPDNMHKTFRLTQVANTSQIYNFDTR